MGVTWESHDPVGRDPVFPSREDANGGQHLLIRSVDVLVHNRSIEEMAVELFNTPGLVGTALVVFVLCVCVCVCVRVCVCVSVSVCVCVGGGYVHVGGWHT